MHRPSSQAKGTKSTSFLTRKERSGLRTVGFRRWCTDSPEHSLLAYKKYGYIWMLRPKLRPRYAVMDVYLTYKRIWDKCRTFCATCSSHAFSQNSTLSSSWGFVFLAVPKHALFSSRSLICFSLFRNDGHKISLSVCWHFTITSMSQSQARTE